MLPAGTNIKCQTSPFPYCQQRDKEVLSISACAIEAHWCNKMITFFCHQGFHDIMTLLLLYFANRKTSTKLFVPHPNKSQKKPCLHWTHQLCQWKHNNNSNKELNPQMRKCIMLPSEFGYCIVNELENTHCKAWQRWNTEYVLNKKTVDLVLCNRRAEIPRSINVWPCN